MSKPIAYLFHGFNVEDGGADTSDKLIPYAEAAGYKVIDIDTGFMQRIRVRLCNDRLARVVARLVKPGSIAIGHSNGCALIHLATMHGAPFSQVAYINPALDRDLAPGPQVEKFHVWHSPSDPWVKLAQFIPFTIWGDMGAVGYQGKDPRGINHNKETGYNCTSRDHSDVFTDDRIRFFGPLIMGAFSAPSIQ